MFAGQAERWREGEMIVQKGAGRGGGGGGNEGAFGTMKETKGRQERQTKPCGRVRPMSLFADIQKLQTQMSSSHRPPRT